jgi:hypothetical protein
MSDIRPQNLALGRSKKSPTPKLRLADFVDVEKAASEADQYLRQGISMHKKVSSYPIFLNDQIGDCTCASIAHAEMLASAYAGSPRIPSDDQVLEMYSAISGYDPRTGNNDNGAMLVDAAGYARTRGLGGKPSVYAYAHVNESNHKELQVAHWLFGGVYTGVMLPMSANRAFSRGQTWDVSNPGDGTPGSWGGHAIWRVDSHLDQDITFVTWGTLQKATPAWWDKYVDEAMALVPSDWQNRMPDYQRKANLVDFSKLTRLLNEVAS